MRIRFLGPLDRVTGSCYWLKHGDIEFLVDCGVRQGDPDVSDWNLGPLPFRATDLKFVVLTHAHIDHCGLLPRLVREGFSGTVYCTEETKHLTRINLDDCLKHGETGWKMKHLRALKFHQHAGRLFSTPHPVAQDLFLVYLRSAHVLGAVSVQVVWGAAGAGQSSITFSGDLGPNSDADDPQSLHRQRMVPFGTTGKWGSHARSYAVLESTYGARLRDPAEFAEEARLGRLRSLVQETCLDRGGVLLLPAFALDRTQAILFDLHVVFARDPETFGDVPVHLYAPLAVRAFAAYRRGLLAADITYAKGIKPRWLGKGASRVLGLDPGTSEHTKLLHRLILEFLATGPEAAGPGEPLNDLSADLPQAVRNFRRLHSRINRGAPTIEGPAVFVTGGGMMDGGPVRAYLDLLRDERNTLALSGYAGRGTTAGRLGSISHIPVGQRGLLHAEPLDEESGLALGDVRARIERLAGYSGHADQAGLVDWLLWNYKGDAGVSGRTVFLTHGDRSARTSLKAAIELRTRAATAPSAWAAVKVELPTDTAGWYDLDAGAWQVHPEELDPIVLLRDELAALRAENEQLRREARS